MRESSKQKVMSLGCFTRASHRRDFLAIKIEHLAYKHQGSVLDAPSLIIASLHEPEHIVAQPI
jgi:hypothetical protein